MKIQKFEITIAVPEGNSTVKIDDLIDTFATEATSSTLTIARLRERRWRSEQP